MQDYSFFEQARSQGVQGCNAPPKSAKRPTFSHKMGQKWGFCKRVKGVRFKKSTFLVQKGPHFWGPAPPVDPGYGSVFEYFIYRILQMVSFSFRFFFFQLQRVNHVILFTQSHSNPITHNANQPSCFCVFLGEAIPESWSVSSSSATLPAIGVLCQDGGRLLYIAMEGVTAAGQYSSSTSWGKKRIQVMFMNHQD